MKGSVITSKKKKKRQGRGRHGTDRAISKIQGDRPKLNSSVITVKGNRIKTPVKVFN